MFMHSGIHMRPLAAATTTPILTINSINECITVKYLFIYYMKIVNSFNRIVDIFTFYIEEQHTPKSPFYDHWKCILISVQFLFFSSNLKYMKTFCAFDVFFVPRMESRMPLSHLFIHFETVQAQEELIKHNEYWIHTSTIQWPIAVYMQYVVCTPPSNV